MEVKNLFDTTVKQEIIDRINKLTPQSQRQWGKMDVAQMLAHCQMPLGVATGKHKLKGSGFLKELLEFNGYTVMSVPTPAPKVAAAPPLKEGEVAVAPPPPPPASETFTLGVTDYTFNTINAIYGRMLKAKDGHIVTMAYWLQQEAINNDEIPYFAKQKNDTWR